MLSCQKAVTMLSDSWEQDSSEAIDWVSSYAPSYILSPQTKMT